MDWKTLIFGSIVTLINYYAEEYRKEDLQKFLQANTTDYLLPHVETYDFIIIGGGIAGCVLANRLSANPNVKVLLLEAGGTPPLQTEVPAFGYDTRYAKSIIYDYKSVPQKNTNNSVTPAPVGKVLGGTSILNLMIYNRGHPKDYDNWAEISGDDSWRYNNVLEHFKTVENYQGEFPFTDQHGRNGPVVVSQQSFAPGRSVWLAAGREKGYPVKDPSGPQEISVNPIEYNKRQGRRLSSYESFVKPIESQRANLKVERYAEATEISFDENNKANAVIYKKHNVYRAAYAEKEVIVSAGSYGSPQLLMKSGIGPEDVLNQAKIKSRVNLPVGQNLMDHPKTILKFLVIDKSITFDPNADLDQRSVDNFERKGKGPLTSVLGLTGQGFTASSIAKAADEANWADIQFLLYGQNLYFLYPDSYENETAIYMIFYLARQKSRGQIYLNATDINGMPVIDFKYLSDPRDIRIVIDGIKATLEIIEQTDAYRRVGASYPAKPHPACSHLPFRTDPYWDCYVRNVIVSGNHPCGTCRMGRGISDPKAVVDSKLRVIGVDRLRVVDASIMPVITNSNLQAAVYMIAEKASVEIKSFWNL